MRNGLVVFTTTLLSMFLGGVAVAEVNPDIGYIRKEIPPIQAPGLEGDRYTAMAPHTLDLAERAALAINAITECTDPKYDHEIYINCYFNRDPALLTHSYHDFNGAQAKVIEALALLRVASGSTQNRDAEQIMLEAALHMTGTDGMSYMPVKGRPWALFDDWGSFLANADPPENSAHIAALWPTGRAMLALEAYYLADDKNPLYDEFLKATIDGLNGLLVDRGDWGYFPGDIIYLDENGDRIRYSQSSYGGAGAGDVDENTPHVTNLNAISFATPATQAAAKYYRLTGYEPARTLAEKLSYWIKDNTENFKPDGSFTGHYHLHVFSLIGMAETGIATGDQELLDFVVKGYEYAKTQGISMLGYFPEGLPVQSHTTSEGCAPADMLILAVQLSRAGIGDYWEDIDRYIRNHIAEYQLVDNTWIERVTRLPQSTGTHLGFTPPEEAAKIKDVSSDRDVINRTVGAIATWTSINDWYPDWHGLNVGRFGWTGCCLGNGARAIYYGWEAILDHRDGVLSVNLLLNRASKWADVNSHLPYTGKADINVKQDTKLSVRIPEWVEREKVACGLNGSPREFQWETGPLRRQYINLGAVKAGDKVEIEFPMVTRFVELDVPFPEDVPHVRLMLKGNEVVDILPRGKNAPLYQRAHYKQNQTLWKQIERFSPNREVDW